MLRPLIATFSAFVSLNGIVVAAKHFGVVILENTGELGLALLILLSVIVGLICFIIENPETRTVGLRPSASLTSAVIWAMENCIEKRQYQLAILLARAMSRPFWLEGRYHERLKLGKLLQKAALNMEKPDASALAQALIDDLGWTNVELNNLKEAKKRIEEGIGYAKSAKDPYMTAKGYRHLSGIAQREGEEGKAKHYLDLAEQKANDISDERRKIEMLAGINIGKGTLCLMVNEKKRIKKAKDHFLEAKNMFEQLNDRERLIKTNMRLGQTYQKLKMTANAYEYYYQSLKGAKALGWLPKILDIDLHLGDLMLEENEFDDAIDTVQEARTIAKYLNLPSLYDEATQLLTRAQLTKNRNKK